MLDIDPDEMREHFDAIADRLTTMLSLLQVQFKVSPNLIAAVAGTVIVEAGGMNALEALAWGSEAGALRYKGKWEGERPKRTIRRSTSGQPGGKR